MQLSNNLTPLRNREESDDAVTNGRNAAEFGYFVLKAQNV
jgi:hypothetical protein